MNVLHVDGVTKTYRSFQKEDGLWGSMKALVKRQHLDVHALKSSSFAIRKGEFVGLLGPNGAGKTTLLKILTGLIRPSTGRAIAFGEYDTRDRHPLYLRRIGLVMGQRNQLNPDLPAVDSFRLAQAIYDIDESSYKSRLGECTELFDLGPKLKVPVRKLSLGERMKMEMTLSLLHSPELLYLDEPTIGLDFEASAQIRRFLSEANRKLGVTVVLTSHYTKDIEELCRRVLVINQGQLVFDGDLSRMDERLQGEKIVTLEVQKNAAQNCQDIWERYQIQPTFESKVGSDGQTLRWASPAPQTAEILSHVLNRLTTDTHIHDLNINDRPLEDIFAEIYKTGRNS